MNAQKNVIPSWFLVFVSALSLVSVCAAAETGKSSRVTKRPTPNAGKLSDAKKHPLSDALETAKSSLKSVEKIEGYEAAFFKKEMVGRRLVQHSMQIKHRAKPFSVYLRFHRPYDGREAIYVEGKHQGKLLVHETGLVGLVGTISLLPTSSHALSESLHPITSAGMLNLVKSIIEQWEFEKNYGEVEVQTYPNATLGKGDGKMDCFVIESKHPRPRRQFNFHLTRLYIDKKTNFPVRVEQYGFPTRRGVSAPLIGEYTFTHIKTNVNLKDIDFDVRNPKYEF